MNTLISHIHTFSSLAVNAICLYISLALRHALPEPLQLYSALQRSTAVVEALQLYSYTTLYNIQPLQHPSGAMQYN